MTFSEQTHPGKFDDAGSRVQNKRGHAQWTWNIRHFSISKGTGDMKIQELFWGYRLTI